MERPAVQLIQVTEMKEYKVEADHRTFPIAVTEDESTNTAMGWATHWDQPDDAVVDFKGGLEIVSNVERP
jgi:hypothetical protein